MLSPSPYLPKTQQQQGLYAKTGFSCVALGIQGNISISDLAAAVLGGEADPRHMPTVDQGIQHVHHAALVKRPEFA